MCTFVSEIVSVEFQNRKVSCRIFRQLSVPGDDVDENGWNSLINRTILEKKKNIKKRFLQKKKKKRFIQNFSCRWENEHGYRNVEVRREQSEN